MKRMTLTLLAMTLMTGTALAGGPNGGYGGYGDPGERFDFARVTNVKPIFENVRVPTRDEVCWREEVRYRDRGHNTVATIGGAVVGGALGSRVGGGNGRRAATVAGALLGAAIGNEASRHSNRHYVGYEPRCEVRTSYVNERRVVGYHVDYEYFGRIYSTRTAYDPGNRIRVAVSVVPAE